MKLLYITAAVTAIAVAALDVKKKDKFSVEMSFSLAQNESGRLEEVEVPPYPYEHCEECKMGAFLKDTQGVYKCSYCEKEK